jgi:MtN3 and saliva related transmembrane protein
MKTDTFIGVVGGIAGFCTTFAFVPQVIKIWKHGGKDLSYGMLGLYLVGVLLWLIYGFLLHAAAIIATNGATLVLVTIATVLKAWTERKRPGRESVPLG